MLPNIMAEKFLAFFKDLKEINLKNCRLSQASSRIAAEN